MSERYRYFANATLFEARSPLVKESLCTPLQLIEYHKEMTVMMARCDNLTKKGRNKQQLLVLAVVFEN